MGNNITFHMNASVDSIKSSSSDPPLATAVTLKDGTTLEADVVILGVGVAPATEFLREGSGIKLEKDGGVLVDEYLRVPGVDAVYAIGDIAVFPQVENRTPRRIEHWNVGISDYAYLQNTDLNRLLVTMDVQLGELLLERACLLLRSLYSGALVSEDLDPSTMY